MLVRGYMCVDRVGFTCTTGPKLLKAADDDDDEFEVIAAAVDCGRLFEVGLVVGLMAVGSTMVGLFSALGLVCCGLFGCDFCRGDMGVLT